MTTLQPLHDRIIVNAPPAPKANEEKIIDGIIIPPVSNATKAAIDPTHFVTDVLAVGHKCEIVKAGQRILVRKPDCFVVKSDDGVDCVMVREQHVVAVVAAAQP